MALLMAERVDRPPTLFELDPVGDGETPAGSTDRATDGLADDSSLGGGLTLDEAIVGAWEGLAAQAAVRCPCCGGSMRPHLRAGATAQADQLVGRCDDCGTTLE